MPENLFSPGKGKPRLVKTTVELPGNEKVAIYAGKAVLEALRIVLSDVTLYNGIRLSQLMGALYEQGKKDGRREVNDRFGEMMGTLSHQNPGRPRKKQKPKKKK